jgi:uncharacterized protein YbjT (DUF2867 family)
MKKLLILGGSGFVGRSLLQQLVHRHPGVHLVVPTRRLAHAQRLRVLPGVEIVEASVHDAVQLTALARGCDAVVNLVAILHGTPAAFETVHVTLPQQIVRAMHGAGVSRLVHVSAIGIARDAPSNYQRTKAAGEAAIGAGGLTHTILRPSVIFGAEDRFLNLFARLQALAPVIPLAGSEARFQPVWVEDVAAAAIRVLEGGPAAAGDARVYECVGPEVMTLSALVRLAGQLSGHARPQIPLPDWAAQVQAMMLELAPGEPLMSRDNLASMRVPNIASGRLPGLAELGITPSPVSAVAPSYLSAGQGVARLDGWRSSHRM